MESLVQVHSDCAIDNAGQFVRAYVGAGKPHEVQACYRALAALSLEHKFSRVLVIGAAADDPHSHLAACDAVIALHVLGVPSGFKIAFVAQTDATLNGYRHAELEARERGLRARVFYTEQDAVRWLTGPDLH